MLLPVHVLNLLTSLHWLVTIRFESRVSYEFVDISSPQLHLKDVTGGTGCDVRFEDGRCRGRDGSHFTESGRVHVGCRNGCRFRWCFFGHVRCGRHLLVYPNVLMQN